MKDQIKKAMQHNQIRDIMYMDKNNRITKRRIKVLKIAGDTFQAYCFVRRANRTFLIGNVLAIMPVVEKERGVV
ncbi:MAG: transcriptional regulator [Niallia sp.]